MRGRKGEMGEREKLEISRKIYTFSKFVVGRCPKISSPQHSGSQRAMQAAAGSDTEIKYCPDFVSLGENPPFFRP